MARALLADFDSLPPRLRNHARWVFLDPAARDLYLDWEDVARDNVAILRLDAGRHPDDPLLNTDQTLFIYSVESGSRSAETMDLLGSWTAEHVASESPAGDRRDS